MMYFQAGRQALARTIWKDIEDTEPSALIEMLQNKDVLERK
jgi:hypothetical protein